MHHVESLHDYFSQFGEVQECTVMRDGATGRSRGFGFLTFKDAKTVNTVMVKEHFLDGKIVRVTRFDVSPDGQKCLGTQSKRAPRRQQKGSPRMQIDPKRAIPRDEQEKTSKIFVGGVSQDATEADFTSFFAQFGRVVDATLMMDKDTGRPRGFGFVTFDSEAAVERCLDYHPLEILGKAIEVKKAQPRGKMGEEEEAPRGGRGRGKFGRDDRYGNDNNSKDSNPGNQSIQGQNAMMGAGGMTPQMMAQYWQRMQQYFAMMQQQMAATAMGGAMGGMGMAQMNPQMMAQMQQMQMQQMQKQMNGGQSPGPAQGMTPQMQQQMMQMMQMQNGGGGGVGGGGGGMGVPGAPSGPGMGAARPGFSAQEQLLFEQQKYEQQQARAVRGGSATRQGSFNNQSPQSWEGMYDDVPQPNEAGRGSAGVVRNLTPSNAGIAKAPRGPTATPQPSNAPVNAPTGPKNAGKPGSNFRGGRGGRYHPYGR